MKKLIFIFFLIYLAVGYYIAEVLQIYHNDAIARTALGFFTVFGRDPHIGAVGFVWQPLPSILQIPLLLSLRPIGLIMMSGPIITTIAGTISVLILYKIGLIIFDYKNKITAFVIAGLFGLNPMILLYSSIGASEMIFISCLLGCSFFLVKWYKDNNHYNLLLASFFVSLSFWSRYEALPAFAGFILTIIIINIFKKGKRQKIESDVIQFSTPFIYSVGIWIAANWLIMKDPFYFMNSPYSNPAFTESLKYNPQYLEFSYNSIIGSFAYVIKRAIVLAPILLPTLFIVPILIKNIKKRYNDFILFTILVTPYVAILLFHVWQLYKGESFGWLRFYIYSLVAGSMAAIFLVNKYKLLKYSVLVFLLLGIITTTIAISNSNIGREEISFEQKITNNNVQLDFSRTYEDQKEVSAFMDKETTGKILLDTDGGFAIPLFSEKPERYIITSDLDYVQKVKTYPLTINWVIVPKPSSDDRGQNKIYQYYPDIWNGNAPDIKLYTQIDDWKIFKVENQE